MSLSRKTGLKRTGFRSKGFILKDQPLGERPPRVITPLARPANYAPISGVMVAKPKDGEFRSSAVMSMAKHRQCLLQAQPLWHDPQTVVACHSNWQVHGKGVSHKAHDCFTVWGCADCHGWLDRAGAPADEKRAIFDAGMRRQVREWRRIAEDAAEPDKYRKAAAEVLEELERRDVGRVYL